MVDGLPGKNKEGQVEDIVKNIREEFSLMLDHLQWMELLLGRVVSIHKFRDTVFF
jgi:hypothetical protein